jgi:uncharacterized protein YjiS (DUF1127 family)
MARDHSSTSSKDRRHDLTADHGSSSGGLVVSIVINSLSGRRKAAASSHLDCAVPCRPRWGTRFLLWLVRCSERSRQRQALSELDDHFLKDIGKTRPEAMAEAAKPFWK